MANPPPNPNSKNRYIAFLDILGFKDMIENLSHEEMIEFYQTIIEAKNDAIKHSTERIAMQSSVTPDTGIHAVLMSDSIIIYTEGDYWYNYVRIVLATQFITARAIRHGYTLRGAIGCGKVYINTTDDIAVMGKTFVDVYLRSEEQQWHGCAIYPEAIRNAEDSFEKWKQKLAGSTINSLEELMKPLGTPIVEYNIPMQFKTNVLKQNLIYAVNWIERLIQEENPNRQKIKISPQHTYEGIAKSLETAFFKDKDPEAFHESVQIKYLNTLHFVEIILRSMKYLVITPDVNRHRSLPS